MPRIDLTTQRFGRLTVIQISNRKGNDGSFQWECLCDCGNTAYVLGSNLRQGGTVSCGCKRREPSVWQLQPWVESQILRLEGRRFERLLVLRRGTKSSYGIKWECLCDCGQLTTVAGSALRAGNTRSCGCLRTEISHTKGRKHPYTEKGASATKALIASYKRHAKERDLAWKISDQEFLALTQQNCFYCGTEPRQEYGRQMNGSYIYNGVDRVDSKQGYVKNNVVASCVQCNLAKRALDVGEFKNWVERIYLNMFNRHTDSNDL